jgi:hypothetical protein
MDDRAAEGGRISMRKIVAGLYTSLNGVVESPERFTGPYFDREVGQATAALAAGGDTLLLGPCSVVMAARCLRAIASRSSGAWRPAF